MKSQERRKFPAMTLLLLIFAVAMVAGAFEYDARTRMLPIIVGAPTAVMLLILLLGETLFPRLIAGFDVDLFGEKRHEKKGTAGEGREVQGRWVGNRASSFMFAWIAAFLILTVLAGYNIAIPTSVFIFMKIYGNQSWLKSGATAIGVWGFTIIVFQYLMGLTLFEGLLFGGKLL